MTALARVHVLVLAAGASRRFGSDKRQALLPSGRSLIQQMLSTVTAAGLPYSVVCRPDDPLSEQLASVIVVEGAELGMGSSLAGAVSQLDSTASAVLILPLDLPLLRSKTILRVAALLTEGTIIRPRCRGRFGHPVGFGRDYFALLEELSGDRGAQSILRTTRRESPGAVQVLEVDDPGIYCDIDTPVALSELSLAQFPEEHR
ncbi:MAG: molybdenum cofactor cytidylyltransferase [Bermanella sp.]|jgi:molybdenum cofactor cytidylyltransferase